MLGINDPWVSLAYVLCLASTALCVIYAWVNWNRGEEPPPEEDQSWDSEEKHVEERM